MPSFRLPPPRSTRSPEPSVSGRPSVRPTVWQQLWRRASAGSINAAPSRLPVYWPCRTGSPAHSSSHAVIQWVTGQTAAGVRISASCWLRGRRVIYRQQWACVSLLRRDSLHAHHGIASDASPSGCRHHLPIIRPHRSNCFSLSFYFLSFYMCMSVFLYLEYDF